MSSITVSAKNGKLVLKQDDQKIKLTAAQALALAQEIVKKAQQGEQQMPAKKSRKDLKKAHKHHIVKEIHPHEAKTVIERVEKDRY